MSPERKRADSDGVSDARKKSAVKIEDDGDEELEELTVRPAPVESRIADEDGLTEE